MNCNTTHYRANSSSVPGDPTRESAEKLDAWQQQFMVRMDMRRVRDQLDEVGEPLSAEQATRIEALFQARPPPTPPQRQKDESNEAFMNRFKGWRQESREHIRAEVSTVLEPRQLERYDELDDMSRTFEKTMSAALPAPVGAPPLAGRAAPPVR